MDTVHSQEELQASILAVHVDLRRKYKNSINNIESKDGEISEREGWETLWKDHTRNLETLKHYSKAMHELATKIWDPRNKSGLDGSGSCEEKIKCRIEWVVSKCQIYFADQLIAGVRLRLLDVGSCYNPFSKYENIFNILPIDLCPAPGFEEIVYQADFLNIEIVEEVLEEKDFELKLESEYQFQLAKLFENRFDLIVFSFFLEYLPSPNQRLESCQRAHKLLRPSGLLFILRPDSNSVTASTMKLIKEMKVGMGLIGFKRLWCEKLQHLWCTAYVKLDEEEAQIWVESLRFKKDLKKIKFTELAQLFSIPQDFKDLEGVKDEQCHVNEDIDVDVDPTLFDELPNLF